ncbi:MAG: type II toxin-antitoxin system RelB/DinJ family antitoxin [Patescibacteria group bacterium]|nr:type II toxin-antitoxin system RelB/DinJ family antitoxin [Patescibacteria group bacterium]
MKTIINVKTEKDLKEQAVSTARDMGIPLSTAINVFLRQFVADRRIVLDAPLKPSKRLEKMLRQAERDLKTGRNLSPIFHSVKELMADLYD